MKIAIPTRDEKLCNHFGHCDQFFVCDIDETSKKITASEFITPPPHEPGLLPKWLGERAVNVIITGGMGQRAQTLFAQRGIKVFPGAPVQEPTELVKQYLEGTLVYGTNACDH